MQPMEIEGQWSKDPAIRKFQRVVESRYSLVISPQMSKNTVTEEGKIFYLARYGFLFNDFICDIVNIKPDHPDNFSYKLLFAFRDLLKSIHIEGHYCRGDNYLFQILKNKKFILHGEGKRRNNNVLSKNGKTLLFMVEEFLYLGRKISKISFTDERIKFLNHSQWDKNPRWVNSPTFEVMLTVCDAEE
jgi:hypothetical protein